MFLPSVESWFARELGAPTAVQRAGWPSIQAGQNTLLLAPTGSGKTLAAFLACLDALWRQPELKPGIRILYISPLKALNNDIARNLQMPIEGVQAEADRLGEKLPRIDVALRTGDTTTAERQRLLRKPAHVLITTPESLHLLLTSQAKEVLRGIQYCIVDEIHALCPNKRGVFLALLLERLQKLNPTGFVRIGLSATQRPLEEVARYLGGTEIDEAGNVQPRPVAIIDAGLRKHLDLQVISPVEHFGAIPDASIWPSIYRRLAKEIRAHRSTIIFCNNRRTVERLTTQLNDTLKELAEEEEEPILVRGHHGSVSLEARRETELALKEGRLRAVVATASLELGIDMGAVDLVCQVESPGNVARGLQRVGRAGHLVGQQSKGRLLAKTLPDLLNLTVLAGEMRTGRVEELHVPINCLDILAQQIIAMVAMEDCEVEALFRQVRQAYPYRSLSASAFDAVLQMITGRYQFAAHDDEGRSTQQLSALQARISWDRVHGRLQALPGSQRLALVHGGTIPDTGQYAVYTGKGIRLGELDEEFVYERRVGDTFLLGTNAWKLDRIETDRVLVQPVQGAPALVPFWRGEGTGRSLDLGMAQGRFLRALAERIDQPDCLAWLQREFLLEPAAARQVRSYVDRQLKRTECLPSDRTIFIEATRDPLGDWQVVLLSPHGRAFHLGLRLALEGNLKRRLGYRPQCVHHDEGILIRLTDSPEPILDLFAGLTVDNVKDLILDELADSALFALRFRQNAARALMMPSGGAGKRAPLWLQRLRGRDLLQVARRYPDFPIVAETFRECLHDHLDLPELEATLRAIQSGDIEIRMARLEAPSPFAAQLLFAFTMASMYHYDGVEPESSGTAGRLDEALLDQLIGQAGTSLLLEPGAIQQVDRRLRGVGMPPRSKPELAEWLRRLGDVSASQLEGPMAGFLQELQAEGIVQEIEIAGVRESHRWVLAEEAEVYRAVFATTDPTQPSAREAATRILHRYLETHALVRMQDVVDRYPLDPSWTQTQIESWARSGRLIVVPSPGTDEPIQWSMPENFDQMQRSTLSIHRREILACPTPQWADFVTRWQYVHPAFRKHESTDLPEVLDRLQALSLPCELWESSVLPARLANYEPRWLDEAIQSGSWTWIFRGDELSFLQRSQLASLPAPETEPMRPEAEALVTTLTGRGGMFTQDLAALLGTSPTTVRAGLWMLLKRGLITNDRFDVLRHGEPRWQDEAPPIRSRGELRSFLRQSTRRSEPNLPEGRWERLAWGRPEAEPLAYTRARLLLERYGIVAREVALLDPQMPAWRILYEVYSRLELVGEVRRGYFVEGLSGAQFAVPAALDLLQACAAPSIAQAPIFLLASLDPANVYGSGAPLDLSLLAAGSRPFPRRIGNALVLQAGRPLLLIEQAGKRLTALPSAGSAELAQAVRLLPELLGRGSWRDVRRKLTVETWNEEPVTTSPGKEFLEAAGFVRDYRAMTLYDAWR